MFSGYYTIASGIMTSQRRVETIGNNLLNIKTPGYRKERTINSAFEQELMSRLDSGGIRTLGDGVGASIAVIGDSLTQFNMGLIKETGNSLDVAINGDGFFNIRGQDGEAYLSRNGSFDIDNEGYLALAGAGRVQGQNGDIYIRTSEISIASDGTVTGNNGDVLGKILVASAEDNTVLERTVNGLFTSQTPLGASNDSELVQGSLELSNVDMNTELTDLIAAQRHLESCASALRIIDQLDRKAASQIASIG